MDKILTLCLAAYCFVVQFGNLFRLGEEEVGLGVSTVLAAFLFVYGLMHLPARIGRVRIFFLFAALFLWAAGSSLLSLTGISSAYRSLALLILYLGVAASVSTLQFTSSRLRIISRAMVFGLLLSSGLTIIDHLGIVNVPGCNFAQSSTHIEGLTTKYIVQSGGFFSRRSAMAALFSISITLSIVLALLLPNWIDKMFYLGAASTACLATLLTHNRSCILAVGLTLILYLLTSKTIDFGRRLKILVSLGVIGIGFLIVAAQFFPQHLDVYKRSLAFLLPGAEQEATESDNVRLDNLVIAFKTLAKNPFGHGFTKVNNPEWGFIDAHNIFTAWLWATGIFALAWSIPFCREMYRMLIGKSNFVPDVSPYYEAYRYAIIAFFLNNMTHNTMSTGLFWIFLGVVVSLRESTAVTSAFYQQWQAYYQARRQHSVRPA